MQALAPIIVGVQGAFGILNGAASMLFRAAAEKNVEILDVQSILVIHAIAAGSISIGYVTNFLCSVPMQDSGKFA
jgi:hypothetical protein